MIKVSEFLLAILLIAELAYVYLSYTGQLKWQLSGHDETSRPPLLFNSMRNTPTETTILTLAGCIFSASSTYQVPMNVMIGIIYVEGGHVGQEVGPNFNGTYDLGLMQVNTLWVPRLAELWHVDYATAYSWVRDDGCENVYVGAWILKQKIVETGTLYNGIAFYHSAMRGPGTAYANKVVSKMKQKDLLRHEQKK